MENNYDKNKDARYAHGEGARTKEKNDSRALRVRRGPSAPSFLLLPLLFFAAAAAAVVVVVAAAAAVAVVLVIVVAVLPSSTTEAAVISRDLLTRGGAPRGDTHNRVANYGRSTA